MLDLRRTVLCDAGRSIGDLSISSSGHLVAVCSRNDDQTGTPVAIYDSETGQLSHRSGESGRPGRAACFANDELWTIQMVEHQWELRVVDVQRKSEVSLGAYQDMRSLAASSDGRFVALVLGDCVMVFDTHNRGVIRNFPTPGDAAAVVAFPAGAPGILIGGAVSGYAVLYDLTGPDRELQRWEGPPGREVAGITMSPTGRYLAVTGEGPRGLFVYDDTVGGRIWEKKFSKRAPFGKTLFQGPDHLLAAKPHLVRWCLRTLTQENAPDDLDWSPDFFVGSADGRTVALGHRSGHVLVTRFSYTRAPRARSRA